MKENGKKKETWKERRRRRWQEFQEKHPKLADFAIKALAVTVVVAPIAGAYLMGYNEGSKLSPKAVQDNFDKSCEELEEIRQQWLETQRQTYLENWNSGKYADNERQFEIFCENIDLQPGESYFLWDEGQFKGEGHPVEPIAEHQVYGIVDPKYQEESEKSWTLEIE